MPVKNNVRYKTSKYLKRCVLVRLKQQVKNLTGSMLVIFSSNVNSRQHLNDSERYRNYIQKNHFLVISKPYNNPEITILHVVRKWLFSIIQKV